MNARFLTGHILVCCLLTATAQLAWSLSPQITIPADGDARPPLALRGQSATLLPDGRWLLLGGQNRSVVSSAAVIQDPRSGSTLALQEGLHFPRAWHTATLLPNGKVLVSGGVGSNGQLVKIGELFDPQSQKFQSVMTGLLPRAHHTATLLTDGRVLVAGGLSDQQTAAESVELWDPRANAVSILPSNLNSERRNHFASLLPNGTVLLWGGTDAHGDLITYGEVYDPDRQAFSSTTFASPSAPDWNVPFLEDSLPADGAQDVPPDALMALRFSKPLRVTSVGLGSLELTGPAGLVPTKVVPAESGMLAFVTPSSPLQPGFTYLLRLQGPVDGQGLRLVSKTISFKVAGQVAPANSASSSAGTGGQIPAEVLPPLKAAPGITALSGQILQLDRDPLPNVTLQIGKLRTQSDRTGRFLLLLPGVKTGHQVLIIDGRTANNGSLTYGLFEVGVDMGSGATNVLGYKIWMPVLDMVHAVVIPSPTLEETIVTTPLLPGLELHIPPKTVIYDHDGKAATKISITPVPIERPPFPLPRGVQVPIYFTIQPGGAYLKVEGDGPKGARLYYPNSRNLLPGTRFSFWNYDADEKGWYVYGLGTVSSDRHQVVPDPGVVIYEFTGAMVGNNPGPSAPNNPRPNHPHRGEPVDPSTGFFIYESTDFSLPAVLPVKLTRTYRQGDTTSRDFGMGTSHTYQTYLAGDFLPYTYMDVVLPDGARIHFPRISSGTGYTDAVYQHTSSSTEFYNSTINWNSVRGGWELRFKDGTIWAFPDSYLATSVNRAAIISVRDRFGNTISINRDSSSGNIKQITSPNGRWLQFTYDASNRVTQIADSVGRSCIYSYDANGRLHSVTDQNQGVTTYAYDSVHLDQLTSITDARQIQYLQNLYDSNGRISRQTLANGGTYLFNYITDSNGHITQTDITDPNGYVNRMSFATPEIFQAGYQTGGYETSETFALGKPEQQTFTYDRGTPTNNSGNFLLGVTDPLGRTTSYTYDASGNLTGVARLSGTTNAAFTSLSYEAKYNRLATISDPLGYTTSFTYNDSTNQVTLTGPDGNRTVVAYDALGQLVSMSDPLTNEWSFTHSGGDLVASSDPLHNTTNLLYDGGGRLITITDPLGNLTQYAYDGLDNLTKVIDPLGNVAQFSYDPNDNLASFTDPLHITTPTAYVYDGMDHLQTRTDPLQHAESYQYDLNGNLTCYTDRRGTTSIFKYDGINRRTFAGFGAANCVATTYQSTITYSYDGSNRLQTASDSISGQITRTYDGFDHIQSETTTLAGTTHIVSYINDAMGRRSGMTVDSQQPVTYSYDAASRVVQITQGTSSVMFTYDAAGHRTSTTLPNGIVMQYSYDLAAHLTGIAYQLGGVVLGNLSYTYDADGRSIQKGGSFANANIPAALSVATFNANNQLTNRAGVNYSYELNGNLTTDGINTYNWNERNQLNSVTGGTSASFQYDAFGRRIGKTLAGIATTLLHGENNVVEELSGSTVTATLLTGLEVDETYSRTDAAGPRYLLSDLLGSAAALTDSAGTIQTQYTYEPFGSTTSSGTISSNSLQYTGRENDGDGLYYYRARYYGSGLQRFISEDPLGFSGGYNVYSYVDNDPIDYVDPFGLQGQEPIRPGCSPPFATPCGWPVYGGGFEPPPPPPLPTPPAWWPGSGPGSGRHPQSPQPTAGPITPSLPWEDDPCYLQYEDHMAWCNKNFPFGNTRDLSMCHEIAALNYERCKNHLPPVPQDPRDPKYNKPRRGRYK